MSRIPLTWFILMVCAVSGATAGRVDTLTYFDARTRYVYYHGDDIDMQAARFVVARPGVLRRLIVTLGGEASTGTITIRIFGHEGGMAGPMIGRDLCAPIALRKTRAGVQSISVAMPRGVAITNNQFFVGVERLSPGVRLLSDYSRKTSTCPDSSQGFYYQVLRHLDGRWEWGRYAFAIAAVIEQTNDGPSGKFVDATVAMHIADTAAEAKTFAWYDFDRDGYLDLVLGAHLYMNRRGGAFDDVSARAGLRGAPRAVAAADFDNDGSGDILFVGSGDSTQPNGVLYRNTNDGAFVRVPLNLPLVSNPTSISISDADGDGYLDAFVGEAGAAPGVLLINDRSGGFTAGAVGIGEDAIGDDSVRGDHRGSQWVDVDGDGRLELFVAGTAGDSRVLRKGTAERLLPWRSIGIDGLRRASASVRGCEWADYDNDGDLDALLPATERFRANRMDPARTAIYDNGGAPGYALEPGVAAADIEYEERQSGGSWGDVNNDGFLDMLLATSCDCRYLDIYTQSPNHRFALATAAYDVPALAAGGDGVWVDFDNDGLLDIATFDRGRFVLLHHEPSRSGGGYVQFDVGSPAGADAAGASVTVYAGAQRYTQLVTIGRGLLMQKPGRLHFGLGNARRVDSVLVRWPGSDRVEAFGPFASNGLYALRPTHGAVANGGAVTMAGYPNPCRGIFTITFTVPTEARVSVGVYTLEGRLVADVADQVYAGGTHAVQWDGNDTDGRKAASGTYVYRLRVPGAERSERLVVVR